jgi:hypothetical protein
MNYTELTENIQEITENTFDADQLKMFTQQAEQKIYNSVQLPEIRKNSTGTCTINDRFLTVPTDFLYSYSMAVIDGSGNYDYLTQVDVNFIREAYPNITATGKPKHYAYFSEDSFLLGPTPDAAYSMQLHYGYYPESIVTAGTTWLGDNFDSALLNGALIEAIRFMKGEEDMVALYEKHYLHAIQLLMNLSDGKLRQDSYKYGQVHREVS